MTAKSNLCDYVNIAHVGSFSLSVPDSFGDVPEAVDADKRTDGRKGVRHHPEVSDAFTVSEADFKTDCKMCF